MGVLELHLGFADRQCRKPDRLVFDVDPDEGLDFSDAAGRARYRRPARRFGLRTFALVTGGKGIHVIVPLTRRAKWPEVKAFASGFARLLAQEEPERFTATLPRRRARASSLSTICATSAADGHRAVFDTGAQGALVAVPVSWDQVERSIAPMVFARRGDRKGERAIAMEGVWRGKPVDNPCAAGKGLSVSLAACVSDDPALAAEDADLVYVSDEDPLPGGGQGVFLSARRPAGPRQATLPHRALAIPGMGRRLICPDPTAPRRGRDQRGRKQTPCRWSEARGAAKLSLADFAKALPRIRAAVDADLRRHGLPREKVVAAIVWLLDHTMIRWATPPMPRPTRVSADDAARQSSCNRGRRSAFRL